jgi:transposase
LQGMSKPKIAKTLGVSTASVYNVLKKWRYIKTVYGSF